MANCSIRLFLLSCCHIYSAILTFPNIRSNFVHERQQLAWHVCPSHQYTEAYGQVPPRQEMVANFGKGGLIA